MTAAAAPIARLLGPASRNPVSFGPNSVPIQLRAFPHEGHQSLRSVGNSFPELRQSLVYPEMR